MQKTWTFSLLGVQRKYTENSKISLSLMLLKIVALFILLLNELHALSLYKPLIQSNPGFNSLPVANQVPIHLWMWVELVHPGYNPGVEANPG